MKAEYVAQSVAGRVRPSNQDSVVALKGTAPGEYVFAVADGVGGLARGEEASRLAVEAVAAAVRDCSPLAVACLSGRLQDANRRIYDSGANKGDQAGTTIVAVVVQHARFVVLHAGDSRAYLWRQGTLERLTDDHAWVQEQVRAGVLTEEQAAHSPYRNVITRCLGIEPEIELEERPEAPLESGDVLLLCSDGLHGLATDAEIEAVLDNDGSVSLLAERLVALANGRGGTDNISVVLARLGA